MNPVFIICSNSIHESFGAAYSRIMCYSKALVAEKKVVYLFSLKDYEVSDLNKPVEIFNNIYSFKKVKGAKKEKNPYKPFNFNLYKKAYSFFKHIYVFDQQFKQTPKYLIYASSSLPLEIISLFFFKIRHKRKISLEKNELFLGMAINLIYPIALYKKAPFFFYKCYMLYYTFLLDFFALFYDGIILISTRLFKLFSVFKKNLLYIPILTEIENDTSKILNLNRHFKIGFFGTIDFKKEGLKDLFYIAAVLKNKYDFIINIYGAFQTNKMYQRILEEVERCELGKNIIFHEKISHKLAKNEMKKQDLLILLRPSNLQTNFGFSTKLAEYLASATPVLCSNVSDNGKFIKNMDNGFIFEAGNRKKMVEMVEYILNNREILTKVGESGKEVAMVNFNYLTYGSAVSEFL